MITEINTVGILKKITNKLSEQRIGDFFNITATYTGYMKDDYTCLKNIRIVK